MDILKRYLPIALLVFIFGQSMPFKFGLVDSVTTDHIFGSVGRALGLMFYERHGGKITGALELLAILLLVMPRTRGLGALLSLTLLSGALFFHFTVIGIAVPVEAACADQTLSPAGETLGAACTRHDITLFLLAIVGWASALILMLRHKSDLPIAARKNPGMEHG